MNISQSLVSIIVRSMDRPTLSEALDSISQQTYTNIQVIVVNATGRTHSELARNCGNFPLYLINTNKPLTRSCAANVGLDNAVGRYISFLDDDDWLMPDHISALELSLSKSIGFRVAYSGIKFASDPHCAEFSIINEEFDAVKLKRGNFIPIHAVLFERDLTKSGCRFDESFDIYEDWDFWLQLGRVTNFFHLNEITAVYRNTGNSGASPLADERSIQSAREKIFDKWKNVWTGSEINELLFHASQVQNPKIIALEKQLQLSLDREKKIQTIIDNNQQLVNDMGGEIKFLESKLIDLTNEKKITKKDTKLEIYELQKNIIDLNTTITQLQDSISEKHQCLQDRESLISEIYASNSWKLTAPVRQLKTVMAKIIQDVKKLIICLKPLIHQPSKIYPEALRFKNAWQVADVNEAKKIILNIPSNITYNKLWINEYRKSFTPEIESLIRERIDIMINHPTVTILMPTYNTPEKLLRKAIDSVTAQLYPFWELCVADDASTEIHVARILKEYATLDSRIRIKFAKNNAGVSSTTNSALKMANSAFVVLFDHDDVLEPQAIFRIVESILEDNPDIVYSDEAVMSDAEEGIINHVHRPKFSLEYLRSHPYIVHLIGFKTDLLRQIGGFDENLRISQDYDLILRASEKATKIVHIPEILYLWRHYEQSTGHMLKGDVMETSRNILTRHLERCGEPSVVEDGAQFNFFNVRYPLEPDLRVAIIIPTKNHGELVQQCIESIVRTVKGIAYDIILIDHASDDESTLEYFDQLKSVYQVLRYEGNFNFSVINNWAVSRLVGDFTHYLFCNNDIEAIDEGWLEKMMALCQKSDIGIVGAKLLYPDRKMIQHAGVCVGMYGIAEHYGKFMNNAFPDGDVHPGYHGTLIANHEMSAVTAACALMRKDAFDAVGGFEEKLAVGFGDVDLCLKTLAAGYRILFCADAVLVHHESFTRGKSRVDPHPEDSAYFSKKWRSTLDKCDPYYNPNLTLQNTKWEAAQPLKFNLNIERRIWERLDQ